MFVSEVGVGSGPVGELEVTSRTIFHPFKGGSNFARHRGSVADDGTFTGDTDSFGLAELVAHTAIDLGPPDRDSGFELSSIGIPTTDTSGEHASDQRTRSLDSSIGTSLPTGMNEFDQFRHFLLSHGIWYF